MSAKRGLGRGLNALIGFTSTSADLTETGVIQVPIDAIGPNPRQPRHSLDPGMLAELAASIREHGLIQPLIVTRAPLGADVAYTLIAGERRWRAAKLAGLDEVPVIIREATPQAMLELALVENIQRADLNPLEEAAAYRTLMDEFGLTQEQVAARVGKSRAAVANSVRLLHLAEPVKEALGAGQISEGHARALLGLPDEPSQVTALDLVLRRKYNVRQTEELVRRMLTAAQVEADPEPEDAPWALETQALEEQLRMALGTRVSLSRSGQGGRLVIYFYSEEELQALYERLVR
ncbi:MAG: ParB/RepB/Spo0J family partition protein [Anaerolineae bacterium]|nr:ParB/RepB/Spo0J family partition protein [Anaerolineae bacterium]MDW8098760.1 ParB/RepB/Spo0J family partition protein [Anaerolineae bacterium]